MRRLLSRLLIFIFCCSGCFVSGLSLRAEECFNIPNGVDLSQPFELGILNGPKLRLNWNLSTTTFTSPWAVASPLWIGQGESRWALSAMAREEKGQPKVEILTFMKFFSIPDERWREIPTMSRMVLISVCILLGCGSLILTRVYLPKSLFWICLIVPTLAWWILPHYNRQISWNGSAHSWRCQKHPPAHGEFISITLESQQTLTFAISESPQGEPVKTQPWFHSDQLNIVVAQTELWRQTLLLKKK